MFYTRIRDIDDPILFQNLVHALMTAEYGEEFQVVDDSGGDLGNDGFRPASRTLYAIYCPTKKAINSNRLRRKIDSDLGKALQLREEYAYAIEKWVFVTPIDLREPEQRYVRDKARERGFAGSFIGETHLTDLFLRHTHLHDRFSQIAQTKVAATLKQIATRISKMESGLQSLVEEFKTSDPEANTTHETESPVNAFPSPIQYVPGSDFLRIQDDILAGNTEKALSELESLIEQTSQPGERLWGIILYLQTDVRDAQTGKRLLRIGEGLRLAESLHDVSALALLKAERAFALNEIYVDEDISGYGRVRMSNLSGLPIITPEQQQATVRDLHSLDKEIQSLFDSATEVAIGNGRYRELGFVLIHRAIAVGRRAMFHSNVPELRIQAQKQLDEMCSLFETAIQLARLLGHAHMRATAHHNFANMLRSLGSQYEARRHAEIAQALAVETGDKDLISKSHQLHRSIADLTD